MPSTSAVCFKSTLIYIVVHKSQDKHNVPTSIPPLESAFLHKTMLLGPCLSVPASLASTFLSLVYCSLDPMLGDDSLVELVLNLLLYFIS